MESGAVVSLTPCRVAYRLRKFSDKGAFVRKGQKNGTSFYELRCISCGLLVREKESSTRCPVCRSPLDVRYDYGYIRARLNRYSLKTSPVKALKYLDFYPLLDLDLVG